MWFLLGEVYSSSGCFGWATLFYCGTQWAFHIIICHPSFLYDSLSASMNKIRSKTADKKRRLGFPHYKFLGIFLTLKDSSLSSLWSDLSEIRTHPSSYAVGNCSCKYEKDPIKN